MNTQTLKQLGISQRDLSRGVGVSLAAINTLCNVGKLPKRNTEAVRQRIVQFMQGKGATPQQLGSLLLPKKNAPAEMQSTEATPDQTNQTKDDDMLLQNANLSEQARKHFKLPRSPFVDDVQGRDDVFQSPHIRYVRETLNDAAKNSGFMALCGESGSGKSTLVEELEERMKDGEVLVIKPYVLAMEGNDLKGKTLKANDIAAAIVTALDPNAKLKRGSQARFGQIHELLKSSRRMGRRHLLVIEEAHCLPLPTLKHLKRFTELKDGLLRLMGVALIAQPELAKTLSSMNSEIREVAQRCHVVTLEPLDAELENYLRHKFARFNLQYEDVFAKDAADAIRARLIQRDRNTQTVQSICHPLAVQNLVCRAMNVAAQVGWPTVDAQAIAGC